MLKIWFDNKYQTKPDTEELFCNNFSLDTPYSSRKLLL